MREMKYAKQYYTPSSIVCFDSGGIRIVHIQHCILDKINKTVSIIIKQVTKIK